MALEALVVDGDRVLDVGSDVHPQLVVLDLDPILEVNTLAFQPDLVLGGYSEPHAS